MDRKNKFQQLKYWKFEEPRKRSGITLSVSGKTFLIRLSGLINFKEALEGLKKIDPILQEEFPGNRLRYSWKKKFWTLPVNDLTIKFLDHWAAKYCIPVRIK